MKTRVLTAEKMDDPAISRDSHFVALRDLGRINRWSGSASVVWHSVRRLARQLGRNQLRVLDVATGGADIPIRLWRLGRAAGLELEIDALDISAQALEFAAEKCRLAGAPVNLRQLDIVRQEVDQRYDLVTCSLFLHHLTNEEAELVLGKMVAAARYQVVVVDLARSRWNLLQVWLATRVLSRSKVVHFDGPQSVRAAFSLQELKAIADRLGGCRFTIRSSWPCRQVLVGTVEKHG